jgi:hypothetical protein
MEREFVNNVSHIARGVPVRIKRTLGKARSAKVHQITVVTVKKNSVWEIVSAEQNGWPVTKSDRIFYWPSTSASPVSIQKQFSKQWLVRRPELARFLVTLRTEGEMSPVVAVPADSPVANSRSFLPSVELTDFWVRGLKRRLRKVRSEIEKANINLSANSPEARRELGQLLERIISVIGYRQQHGVGDFSEFGRGGRFDDPVTDQLLNRVPISGDEATAFLALLYSELLAHLRSHEIVGAWGVLSASGKNMNMNTKPAVPRQHP